MKQRCKGKKESYKHTSSALMNHAGTKRRTVGPFNVQCADNIVVERIVKLVINTYAILLSSHYNPIK